MAKSEAQAKREIIDANFIDYKIEYPFCYKVKNEKDYFRYMEDGRFEHIWIDEHRNSGIMFGNYANRINQIVSEDNYWFKIIANRHIIITNEEFEIRRNYILDGQYIKYLNGELYIGNEVQYHMKGREQIVEVIHTLKEKPIDLTKQNYEGPLNDDIISNNDEAPF